PHRAHAIAGLQQRPHPRTGPAADQAKVPAVLTRQKLGNGGGFAMPPHAQHDAFVGPFHGGSLQDSAEILTRLVVGPGVQTTGERIQLGRPRRNSMIAALTSAGRSCWVQCPQPGSIWMSRRRGTCCFMLAMCSAAPGNATTRSWSPAM